MKEVFSFLVLNKTHLLLLRDYPHLGVRSEFVEVKCAHEAKESFHSFLCLVRVLASCPYFLPWLAEERTVKNFELSLALRDG